MKEVGFAVNKNGLVPPLEDVTHPSVMPIELLCVDPIELTHAPGEIRIQSLDNQLIVIGHQAVGITHPVHPPADLTEEVEECLAVLLVHVNNRTVIATRGDMIDRSRKL
jgi:hypothetical protein